MPAQTGRISLGLAGTSQEPRLTWVVGAVKIAYEDRDVAHAILTPTDDRGYYNIIGADDDLDSDSTLSLGENVTYRVELTAAEADQFAAASNCRYIELDIERTDDVGVVSAPAASSMRFMRADFARVDQYHGRDVLIGMLDGGTTTAVRSYLGITMVAKQTFGPDQPGSDEITSNHGCLVVPCLVPPGGKFLDAIVSSNAGTRSDSASVAAARWCADQGAKVINYSGSGPTGAQVWVDAMQYLLDRGVQFFASAGNDNLNQLYFPAAYSTTFSNCHSSISFDENTGARSTFSCYDNTASGCAPGTLVLGMTPGGVPQTWNGTSASAPHMALLCAMGSTGGKFTPAQVGAALKANTRNTGQPAEEQGGGAYDLEAALTALGGFTGLPAQTFRRNLNANPSFETNTTGYLVESVRTGLTATAVARSTTIATPFGTGYGSTNVTGNGTISATEPDVEVSLPTCTVTGGQTYTFSAHSRHTSPVNPTLAISVEWQNASGTTVGTAKSALQPVFTSVWARYNFTASAPSGATRAVLWLLGYDFTDISPRSWRFDGFHFEQTATLKPYFDGATSGAAWDGTANSSTSTVGTAPTGGSTGGGPVTPAVARSIPVTPAGFLGQFNMSDSDYIMGLRFELDQQRTIDRWYFTINGEGSTLIGGRTGYGNGTGGTWYGRIVDVNQTTGLPLATVLASETVATNTAHNRARSEFSLALTDQIHWVQFSPVTLQPGRMYAFLLSNTDPSPGSGGSASTGNHMSVNLNWTNSLAALGPNGANTLTAAATGATCGLGPRETAMWSDTSGSTWKFGDQVGWYNTGNSQGRTWVCGYRVSGGANIPHGWPFVNWPSDQSGRQVTYVNAATSVSLTQAGGASSSSPVGVITVTNVTTGVSGSTGSLGSGFVSGVLSPSVSVAAGQTYRISASGSTAMGSPSSGHGAVFDLGVVEPWKLTSNGTNSQVPMLYATPHPFFGAPAPSTGGGTGGTPTGGSATGAVLIVKAPTGVNAISNNLLFATTSQAGLTRSGGAYRRDGVGPELVLLERANVGIAGDPNELDGTGLSITGIPGDIGTGSTPGGGTGGGGGTGSASNPGDLLKVGLDTGFSKFNIGIGFISGDPLDRDGDGHVDFTLAEISNGIVVPGHFEMTDNNTAVKLTVPASAGTTSANTANPRTEFRELKQAGDGSSSHPKAAWTPGSGDHKCFNRGAVDRAPAQKPQIVMVQTHDASDDTSMLRYHGGKLQCRIGDTVLSIGDISWNLGTFYDYGIQVTAGQVKFWFGPVGAPVVVYSGSFGWSTAQYFKCGNYLQANETNVDADEYGVTRLQSVMCWHTGDPEPVVHLG